MVRGDVRDLEFLNDSWLEDVDFDGILRFLDYQNYFCNVLYLLLIFRLNSVECIIKSSPKQ